uniref:C6 domain-containing protein n=1 Tax=Strongyloides venezuelensis TaxID=75913 RepID=A0A0K0FBU8_STRVS
MIFKYLLKFNVTLLLISYLSYVYGCLPIKETTTTPPPVCCESLKLAFARVKPVTGSTSAGWDQCSLLDRYNNDPCPSRGMFSCRLAPYTTAINTNLQLIQNNATVVYEFTQRDRSEIWVNCVNGEWKINGKSFTHVSCSQN